jgi:hypothetical protein
MRVTILLSTIWAFSLACNAAHADVIEVSINSTWESTVNSQKIFDMPAVASIDAITVEIAHLAIFDFDPMTLSGPGTFFELLDENTSADGSSADLGNVANDPTLDNVASYVFRQTGNQTAGLTRQDLLGGHDPIRANEWTAGQAPADIYNFTWIDQNAGAGGAIGKLTIEFTPPPDQAPVALRAGDANQDLSFDQLDLVQVQVAAKYLTGQAATWGEGDWNGAPGGSQGDPPAGDGSFNQIDIVAAQQAAIYLTGQYGAIQIGGVPADSQTSVGYNAQTGEVWVDAPVGTELTSINIDSASGIFTGDPAQNLGGSFDNDGDNNIFKATFGSIFGTLSVGRVAATGLSEQFVSDDLTVVGSLAGGGGLGDVDLLYVPVPEPSTLFFLTLALLGMCAAPLRSQRH